MAPIRPGAKKSKTSIRARAQRSATTPSATPVASLSAINKSGSRNVHENSDNPFGQDLRGNKKDKRTVRHNQLLAKVQAGAVRKRPLKRRRPAKAQIANGMDGLAQALPDIETAAHEDAQDKPNDDDSESEVPGLRKGHRAGNKMVMKSLRLRPGAMKKRDKLESNERDRFAKNLAGLLGPGSDANHDPSSKTEPQQNRWAALRTFIGSTMETNTAVAPRKVLAPDSATASSV